MKSEQVSSPETDLPVATLAKVETSYRDVLDETYGPRPGSPSRGDSGAKKEADANQSGTGNPAADADAPGAQFLDMLTGDISTESGDDRSGSVDVDKVEISSSPGDVTGVDDKPLKKDGGDAKNPKTESEPISKMLEWMDKNFDVLDADKDGNLTKAEIGAAMLDPKLGKGEGAAYLSTAFRHANDMGAAAAALRSGDKPQPGDAKNAGETKPVDEGTAEKKPVDKRGPVPAPAPQIDGLMTITPNSDEKSVRMNCFNGLRTLRDELARQFNMPLPILSMGMTDDWQDAIECGSNMIRVGRAIFGH